MRTMQLIRLLVLVVCLIGAIAILPGANAEEHKKYGAELEGFDYPYEIHRFQFTSQGDDVFMAYMDIPRNVSFRQLRTSRHKVSRQLCANCGHYHNSA
jgi:uncharacterized lipoprotein YehR (DUF1307 family)